MHAVIYAPVQVSNGIYDPNELPLITDAAAQLQAEKVPINWIKADVISGSKQLITANKVPRYIVDAHTSSTRII